VRKISFYAKQKRILFREEKITYLESSKY